MMKILFWFMVAGLALLAMFAAANWGLITAPASINFLAFTVEVPLGVILLGATLVFVLLGAVYVLSLRTATLMELRQRAKELEAQRALAEHAEASRFTELQALIGEVRAALATRIDALERTLLGSVQDSSNSLAAYVGEVDEKLERMAPPAEKRP